MSILCLSGFLKEEEIRERSPGENHKEDDKIEGSADSQSKFYNGAFLLRGRRGDGAGSIDAAARRDGGLGAGMVTIKFRSELATFNDRRESSAHDFLYGPCQ